MTGVSTQWGSPLSNQTKYEKIRTYSITPCCAFVYWLHTQGGYKGYLLQHSF